MTAKDVRALLSRHRVATVTLATLLILLISGTVYAQTPGGRDTLQLMLHGSLNTKDTSIDSEDTGLPETDAVTSSPVEVETDSSGVDPSLQTEPVTETGATEGTDAAGDTTSSTGEATTTAAATTATTTKATTASTTKATTAATTAATTKATTSATTAATTSAEVVMQPDMAAQVLALVNAERALEINGSLPPLAASSSLNETATVRVQEIVVLFSHTRPDNTAWSTAFTSSWSYKGENIAKGQTSAEQVVNAWMASEGHKENILYTNFTHMGISCCFDGEYYYWAQEFGG